jgi:hypothetical protein
MMPAETNGWLTRGMRVLANGDHAEDLPGGGEVAGNR